MQRISEYITKPSSSLRNHPKWCHGPPKKITRHTLLPTWCPNQHFASILECHWNTLGHFGETFGRLFASHFDEIRLKNTCWNQLHFSCTCSSMFEPNLRGPTWSSIRHPHARQRFNAAQPSTMGKGTALWLLTKSENSTGSKRWAKIPSSTASARKSSANKKHDLQTRSER